MGWVNKDSNTKMYQTGGQVGAAADTTGARPNLGPGPRYAAMAPGDDKEFKSERAEVAAKKVKHEVAGEKDKSFMDMSINDAIRKVKKEGILTTAKEKLKDTAAFVKKKLKGPKERRIKEAKERYQAAKEKELIARGYAKRAIREAEQKAFDEGAVSED